MSPINAGKVRFGGNLIDPSLHMYISETDADGTNIADFLRVVDDSTSTIKGHVKLSQRDDASNFNIYSITSTSDNTDHYDVNVTFIDGDGNNIFGNGTEVVVTFSRTGDKGIDGTAGSSLSLIHI